MPPGSADDAVRFVDMSRASLFFDALDSLFPQPMDGFGPPPQAAPLARAAAPLVVHDVGDFEASFVPSQRDFQRLDRRFRLEPEVWAALPQYRDWGFAVFKLRSARPGGIFEGVKRLLGSAPSTLPQKRHPMAFEFPRRDPTTLFYPAVHVHDGHVHPRARFDHTLYGQEVEAAWEATLQPASGYGLPDEVKTSLRLDATVQRFRLQGDHPNEDVVVPLARTL